MNWYGIIIGLGSFLFIGLLHPVVIKTEYYLGKNVWPVFLISGGVCLAVSLFLDNLVVSILLSVFGFALFWSILELHHQEERVEKGWFPQNPKRKYHKNKEEDIACSTE